MFGESKSATFLNSTPSATIFMANVVVLSANLMSAPILNGSLPIVNTFGSTTNNFLALL